MCICAYYLSLLTSRSRKKVVHEDGFLMAIKQIYFAWILDTLHDTAGGNIGSCELISHLYISVPL